MAIRTEHSSLRQGLVGAWCPSLRSGGYRVPDLSGRNADGSLQTSNYLASGSGLSMSSLTPNWLSASPSVSFGSSASLSLWVKKVNASSSSEGCWVCQGVTTASNHYAYGDGTCYISTFLTSRIGFAPLASVDRTQWHNVCITTNGVTWSFYQAGNLTYSQAAPATVSFSPSFFAIGRSIDASGFGGTAWNVAANWDDIRLYSRALTPAEIRLLASRRGIGLQPLPNRAAGLPRKLSVNVGGTWRAADAYVNVGGVWKLGQASVNVAGTWR